MKKKRVEEEKRKDAVEGLLNLLPQERKEVPPTPAEVPFGHCNSEQCKHYFKVLEDECQALRTENILLKEKQANVRFDEISFANDNEKVRFFTGIPTYCKLMMVFDYTKDFLMPCASIPIFQQFVRH